MNKSLDEALHKFAARRLTEPFPYLIVDARYEKVREGGVIVSQAVLIAVGRRRRRAASGACGRTGQSREPVELARFPDEAEAARPVWRRVCRIR